MALGENEQIREKLNQYPDAKLGFVVYRCTYKSDEEWDKFMTFLNSHTQHKLEDGGIGDLYSRLDWNVQQDPSLEDASEEQVRERFRKWIEEGHEANRASPRHRACVMVTENDVNWVVNKEPMDPTDHDGFGILATTLISKRDEDGNSNAEYNGDDNDDEDDEEEFEEFDPNKSLEEQKYAKDDSEDEEEDSKPQPPSQPPRDRVSSTRVGLSYLVPRVWSLLDAPGWHSFAVKEGDVATP